MCHTRYGGPRTLSRIMDANRDSVFVKKALSLAVPKIRGVWSPLALSLRPPDSMPISKLALHFAVNFDILVRRCFASDETDTSLQLVDERG